MVVRGNKRKKPEDDGSYDLDPTSECNIRQMIAQREAHRQNRSYEQSDAIREELRNLGVELFDKDKTWRSQDGRSGPFCVASSGTPCLSAHEIQSMVAQRELARKNKDFDIADSIRTHLRANGVEMHDREATWRSSDGLFGKYSAAVMPESSWTGSSEGPGVSWTGSSEGPGELLSDDEIQTFVEQREEARKIKDFERADAIRSQLRASGVETNDKDSTWRASDGRTGRFSAAPSETIGQGMSRLSNEKIQSMVAEREQARKSKDFEHADQIRTQLRANGVETNDKDSSWRASDGRTGRYPTFPPETTHAGILTDDEIQAFIAEREESRKLKDFENADNIRTQLRSYGVETNDKDSTWCASDGRMGSFGMLQEGQGECSYTDADIHCLISDREEARSAKDWERADNIRAQLRANGVETNDKDSTWRAADGRMGSWAADGPVGAETAGAGQECGFDDDEIQSLISEREEARKAKDFEHADGIRTTLRASGVEMNDKESTWKTSDGRMGRYNGPNFGTFVSPAQQPQKIQKLVSEREKYRAASDFESADEIRRNLSAMGVELFDSEKMWRASDGTSGVIIVGCHESTCRLSDAEIQRRIIQREESRHSKDFGTADMIRDELRKKGVECLDGQKVWATVDGRQGPYAKMMPARTPLNIFGSVQSILASPTTVGASIKPPATLTTLKTAPTPTTLTTTSIKALVLAREQARSIHDWKAADEIRADLKNASVDVWDKDKRWNAADGRSGQISR